jgi:ACS family hexuronate transporter-like MFS transporter
MSASTDAAAGSAVRLRPAVWSGYPWVVLTASLLVQTSASLGNQSISPLAPFLVSDLELSRGQVGLVVAATHLGASCVLVLAGNLSDRFGVRLPFLLGLVAAGIPLGVAAIAPEYVWLLAVMALYGVGNGIALPPTTRAIVEWFSPRRRGLAMGVKQTGVALAGVICGLAVPPLASTLGWRGTLVVLGIATGTAGGLAWLAYRDHEAAPPAAGHYVRPGVRALVSDPNLLLVCGVTWLYAAVQLSIIGFMVLFLSERLRLEFVEAGALLAVAQAGGVVGRVGWGLASDTLFGGRRKVVMGLIGALAAASLLALAMVGPGTPRSLLWVILLSAGISAIGWNGINMTFVAEIAGRRASATAAGLSLTASSFGIMVGPPLFGLLVDVSGSYAVAFQAGASLYLVALFLLTQVRPSRHEDG